MGRQKSRIVQNDVPSHSASIMILRDNVILNKPPIICIHISISFEMFLPNKAFRYVRNSACAISLARLKTRIRHISSLLRAVNRGYRMDMQFIKRAYWLPLPAFFSNRYSTSHFSQKQNNILKHLHPLDFPDYSKIPWPT